MNYPNPEATTMEGQAPQDTEQSQETRLRELAESINLADDMDEDELETIGKEARAGFDDDYESRSDWDKQVDQWTKLAIQCQEQRTFPWPKSSNVKYPLISTAAMQFAARAYPALVPANGSVVNAVVVGKDPTGEKLNQAQRVSEYMSYQIMHEVPNWEESMDKMLIMLPVVGTIFKKTYWCSVKKVICSEVILPKNLVVNYWTTSLEDSERISQIMEMSPRLLKERQMAGTFLDIDLGAPPTPEQRGDKNQAPANDATTPYVIIEQHTYLDLDKDGYKEPYVVTFHKESGKVLRISARFDEDTMYFDDKGKLEKICAIQYFTKFGFIPNPDGSFYDMGFGTLLGPLNESVNTIINQLVDSGTLNNLQSGFLGKGLRLKLGESRFTPGEWKSVNATGQDLKQQIMPLPTKEPSSVLFQLMGALITSGKELASVAEIFTGKMPGQNTPATTTMATVEQGMKVFTAVYKRIYRSLNEELKKMYALNGVYLNPNTYSATMDTAVGPDDFRPEKGVYSICPGADPSANSQQEKMQKAQALVELMSVAGPLLDPLEVFRRLFEAMEQPNPEKLFNPQIQQTGQMPPPPPDPKMLEMQAKVQTEQQSAQIKAGALQQKMELEGRDKQQQMLMAQQSHAQEMANKAETARLDAAAQLHKQRIFMVQGAQDTAVNAAKGQQALRQGEEAHQQKMQQQRQQAAAKPKPKGDSKN